MAGAEAEGRRESEAEAEDEWASEAEGVPLTAAFGKKLNLKGVREWGEKVWVHVEKGDKLSGRVHKGHWLVIDEESKGVRVWWPDTKTVGIERNVYYDNLRSSDSRSEGKDDRRVETRTDKPFVPKDHFPADNPEQKTPSETLSAIQTIDVPAPNPEPRERCIQKPSQRVHRECHGFLWGTGTGWEFRTPKKPVPVARVLGYPHRDPSHA